MVSVTRHGMAKSLVHVHMDVLYTNMYILTRVGRLCWCDRSDIILFLYWGMWIFEFWSFFDQNSNKSGAFHHKYLVACIDISILKHILCGLLTGLEKRGVRVGVLAQFSVQTVNAGCGPLAVGLFNPNGKAELVRQRLCVIHTLIKLFCRVYGIHPWVPAYSCISYHTLKFKKK